VSVWTCLPCEAAHYWCKWAYSPDVPLSCDEEHLIIRLRETKPIVWSHQLAPFLSQRTDPFIDEAVSGMRPLIADDAMRARWTMPANWLRYARLLALWQACEAISHRKKDLP